MYYTKYIYLVCFLFFGTLAYFPAKAQEKVFMIEDGLEESLLGQFSEYLRLESDSLSFEQIRSGYAKQGFQPVGKDAVNFGFSSGVYWVRLKISNRSSQADEWILESGYPIVDSLIYWFEEPEGNWQSILTGDMVPFSARSIKDRKFLFPLYVPVGQTRTLYFQIKTQSSVQLPLKVRHRDHLYQENIKAETLYGIFYGITLVMVLYNLFIFLFLRDINYLYYVISIGAGVMFFTTTNGHALYIWGEWVWWANKVVPLSMGLLAFGSALFAQSFLEAYRYAPIANRILSFIKYTGALLMLMAFVAPYGITVRIAAALLGIDAIAILIAGIICWREGFKAARYFVVAWASYLLGAILLVFRNFGLVPNSFFVDHAVEIGNAMEVILLSLALSDKYRLFRKEKEKAQAEALRIQREANETLEAKVKERTQALAEANEELNNTIEELDITNTRLNEINSEVEKKNADITASINYAKRIQESMLPKNEVIGAALDDFFVYFQPRDIVSGDFYWFTHIENTNISVIAAVDCTGHGVPGAFMSMIGNELLHEIIDTRRVQEPSQILDQMHAGIRKALRQQETANQDGMDMSLCVIDHREKNIHFGGAKNPLIYIQDGQLHHIRGSKFSIGGKEMGIKRSFESYTLSFREEPVCCYLFSDGFADQFGGPSGRKFMLSHLKSLLYDLHPLPMHAQGERLKETMNDWKSYQHKQIDDILVLGFRLS